MKSALLGAVTLGAAALGAATLAATPARADLYNPVWTVRVWQPPVGSSTQYARLPVPSPNPLATFTYSGQIDFSTNSEMPSFGQFLDNTTATSNYDTSAFSAFSSNSGGSLQDFLGTEMTNNNNGDNGNLYSYMDFSLQNPGYIGPGAILSVTHKRGVSVYAGNYTATTSVPSGDTLISASWPKMYIYGQPHTDVVTLPVGNAASLDVVYVAEGGSHKQPYDVLKVAVPEPGSLALLGTGLFGLGLIVRRRRRA